LLGLVGCFGVLFGCFGWFGCYLDDRSSGSSRGKPRKAEESHGQWKDEKMENGKKGVVRT
jgi:hypothetical protein